MVLKKKKKVSPKNAKQSQRLTEQGFAFEKQGQNKEAIQYYQKALDKNPENPTAAQQLGSYYQKQGRPESAAPLLAVACRATPNNALLLCAYANCLCACGKQYEAIEYFKKALTIKPDFASACQNLAHACRHEQRFNEAIVYYDQLKEINDSVIAYTGKGLCYSDQGAFENAKACYQAALEKEPACGEAIRQLLLLEKQQNNSQIVQYAERIFESLAPQDRMLVSFGLAKAFEESNDQEKLFYYLYEANRLKRNSFNYHSMQTKKDTEILARVFDQQYFQALAPIDDLKHTPIFIVGMPRSGTSLVEQILASHSAVHGGGELNAMAVLSKEVNSLTGEHFPGGAKQLSREQRLVLQQSYWQRLQRLESDKPFITDKMPQNFLLIGFIQAIIPNAKFIYCQRNALDTCWSIYKSYFSGHHAYAYDLKELGEYYTYHQALMAHWFTVLGDRMYTVEYEKLIDTPEQQTRALLDYCDLAFEADCLHFYKTKRTVSTTSAQQVRQPIYKTSVSKAEQYRTQLAPLVDVLEP